MTTFDPQAFKRATRENWDQSAEGWNNHGPAIRDWLAASTDAMLDMAGIRSGMHVLDVAAGAGNQTLDIAARVGPRGHVLATDLSSEILRYAERNAQRAGYRQVETRVADGEDLPVQDATFDAAICRLGLMFLPDPAQGLREIRRALKPGGGLCTMVFSKPDANPCVAILMATAFKHAGVSPADPFQPGAVFSLGKPGLIDSLFKQCGFREIATTAIPAPFALPSARHYLEFVRASASPIRQILGKLPENAQQAAWADMEEKLKRFDTPKGWVGPNELLLTAARA